MDSFLFLISLLILFSSADALSAISSSERMHLFISDSSFGWGSRRSDISEIEGISGTSSERKALTSLTPAILLLTARRSLIDRTLPLRAIFRSWLISPNSPTGILPLYTITETASVVSVKASFTDRTSFIMLSPAILSRPSWEPAMADNIWIILL